MKKTLKIVKNIVLLYIIYFFITVALIFKLPIYGKTDLSYDTKIFKTSSNQDTYVKMFEDTKEALDIRLAMINVANTTIDMSYLRMNFGEVGEYLVGSLIKKADEGIKIRIIIDGLMYDKSETMKALISHKNITKYVFEPTNFLLPHFNNNLIHDKILLTDGKYGLIGGRNIGERFLNQNSDIITLDRDVLVYSNTDETESVIEMKEYLEEVIDSKYAKEINYKDNDKYQSIRYELVNKANSYISSISNLDEMTVNSTKVEKASFIRSPLNRMNKKPIVFNTIEKLMEDETDIIIQSPYFTPSKSLSKYYYNDVNKDITFITNNMTANPNLGGVGGYFQVRKKMAKNNTLYESQSKFANHAKSLVIGDDISIIGSLNMDNRSIHLSTESMLVIYSTEFNSVLRSSFNDLINNSLQVDNSGNYIKNDNITELKRNKLKHIMIGFISVIASLFNEML